LLEEEEYILAIDEGTTSVRAIVFNKNGEICGVGQYEFTQIFPKPGWVEHDPQEIWLYQVRAIRDALEKAGIEPKQVNSIGVTNQRETTVLWDAYTGKPVYNAIVWQCRRTAEMVEEIRREYGEVFKERTGLVPDSYFSATKVRWILDNVPGVREKAERGEIKFGTIDTYLIWKLTGGEAHIIDYTNASRTMLFNIHKLNWDQELLDILKIPESILPEPRPSSDRDFYGYTMKEIFGYEAPISGDAGDQQAALFGQAAHRRGMAKNTYGTGCFILMNTGAYVVKSERLLTTVAWSLRRGEANYALEGSVFIAGAAVQWLRDGLKIIRRASECDELAYSLKDNEGVYMVPAFVGLGAPYWNQYARGIIIGITRSTDRRHFARSALEAQAYLTRDVIDVMVEDSGVRLEELRVDGGGARSDFLLQFQADILGVRTIRPSVLETTALGAAYLAGLATEYWSGLREIRELWKADKVFEPKMDSDERERLYRRWRMAVERSLDWARED